jgi:hypothetical protein
MATLSGRRKCLFSDCLTLKKEALLFSETSVVIYHLIRLCIPEGLHFKARFKNDENLTLSFVMCVCMSA